MKWNYEQVVVGPKNIKVSIDAKNKRKIRVFSVWQGRKPPLNQFPLKFSPKFIFLTRKWRIFCKVPINFRFSLPGEFYFYPSPPEKNLQGIPDCLKKFVLNQWNEDFKDFIDFRFQIDFKISRFHEILQEIMKSCIPDECPMTRRALEFRMLSFAMTPKQYYIQASTIMRIADVWCHRLIIHSNGEHHNSVESDNTIGARKGEQSSCPWSLYPWSPGVWKRWRHMLGSHEMP